VISDPIDEYDPFVRGRFPVGVRTIEALDPVRKRLFPCEIWYPAAAEPEGEEIRDAAALSGGYPLVVYSHGSAAGARRMSTFLCTHLASHGYVVAALDHFEVVATELARRDGESEEERTARSEAWIANRVPDIRFLLDRLLSGAAWDPEVTFDPTRIGIMGYSFGGWTALAATAVEWRIRAVVALAPGGSSRPKPGILPAKLTFAWGRDVPALYLVGESDTFTPLDGMCELFSRTPASKRMVILRRADHLHFLDDVERSHEAVRTMSWTGALSWIPEEMRPIEELCSGEEAHLFARGLTLGHMDSVLGRREEARRFWAGDVQGELAKRGVDAIVHQP
jgi:predicted dienelactone hydrolase